MKTIRLNKNGASLSETLVTVLLLGIVLSAVTTGVHAMSDSYFSIRRRADAESLLMTASDVISGDLRNVTSVDQDQSGKDAYYCESRYSFVQYNNDDDDDRTGIQVQYLSYTDGGTLTADGNDPKPLVTQATNADQLYTELKDDQVYFENGYFRYTLEIHSKNDDSKVAEQEFDVKPLNDIESSPSPIETSEADN